MLVCPFYHWISKYSKLILQLFLHGKQVSESIACAENNFFPSKIGRCFIAEPRQNTHISSNPLKSENNDRDYIYGVFFPLTSLAKGEWAETDTLAPHSPKSPFKCPACWATGRQQFLSSFLCVDREKGEFELDQLVSRGEAQFSWV